MDRIMMQLSELIIVMQSVNEKRGQPAVLKSFQLCAPSMNMWSRSGARDPNLPLSNGLHVCNGS